MASGRARLAAGVAAAGVIVGGCGAEYSVLPGNDVGRGKILPEERYAGLGEYRKRCERLAWHGGRARVLFEADKEMTRGETEAVAVAVTLNRSAPAEQLLHREGAAEEPGVLVSCRLRAMLLVPDGEFDFDGGDGWVERSLLSSDTARWSWYVTPTVGGDHTLVVRLRPIVALREPKSSVASVAASNVQEYETQVHVEVPVGERIPEAMSRLAATFGVAEELVVAATGFLVAGGGLLTVLGLRRRRGRKAPYRTRGRKRARRS